MHQCIKFILFWNDTLHVSDGLSVHHQEFKTVHTATGICQIYTAVCLLTGTHWQADSGMLYVQSWTLDDGRKDRPKHVECHTYLLHGAFYGTRRFITALISVRHPSLSWASPIQSIYPHPTSWRSSLILSTHLRLGLPSGLFPSGFPTKTLYTPSPHPYAPHLILLDFIIRTILGEEYKSFSSSLYNLLHSPVSSSLLGPNILLQHHVLKHPQLPFLPPCQRPSFTPIQNNRQNYSSIYLNL